MKKTLLTCAVALVGFTAFGQISTYVLQPADLSGPLEFNMADGWGLLPDMSNPANLVQGFAALVDDGSANPNQGCDALINGADIQGKIAVVYRGTCEFGLKALNAQNAGAIAVVIVNNAPGAPVGMAAGVNGGQVSVPVVMISQDAGAMLHDEIVAGNVEMLIGNIQNLFPNNLSLKKARMLIPTQAARPQQVSTGDDNFSVELGGWVYNFGSDAQPATSLKCTVINNGSTVYDQTSNSVNINPGDSAYISLPTFTQANGYTGRYTITYTAQMGEADDFPDDNTFTTSIVFGSLVSYSPLDEDNLPLQEAFYRPASEYQLFGICGTFSSPHASRLKADGVYAAISVNSPATVDGRLINVHLYEWDGNNLGSISEVMQGEYAYEGVAMERLPVFVPFFESITLTNNQEYLFCASTPDAEIFLGHASSVNYSETEDVTDVLTTLLHIDDEWSGGWTSGEVPAMALQTSDAVGIHEQAMVELTPYPNPTHSSISIPMTGMTGKATIQVMDAKGAKVADRQVTIGGNNLLTMDLNELNGGVYMFHVLFENGTQSDFRVVVTK
ncbi:MAG TPA: T9SS type A sorting domain-containing protein [Flavobacteriales bacterium]|nr:T9SS type A sorting domain-containing protein [Flavobacteriales bacterium]